MIGMHRKLFQRVIIIISGLLLIAACKKKTKTEVVEIPATPGRPSVTTLAVDSISSSSVVLSGQITREGNGDISTAGFCWSDEKLPLVDETPTNYQFPDNKFRYRLTGLKPGTNYNFRAFATNEKGIGYGEVITFKTLEGWKKLEVTPNPQLPMFNDMASTGTKLVGLGYNAIYTSNDNGLTWSSSSNSLMGNINCIANKGEILFAGTSSGLYVSNNGGGIWIPATNGLPGNNSISRLHVHENYIFAANTYSVFRSADNGATWAAITFSNSFDYIVGMASQGSSIMMHRGYFTYQSDDNGTSWSQVSSTQNIYPNDFKGTANALVAISSQQIYRSVDKGKTWINKNLSGYFNKLTTSGNNAVVYGNGSNGIYISLDGGDNWFQNSGGLQGTTLNSCVFHKNYILASTYNGLYKLVLN